MLLFKPPHATLTCRGLKTATRRKGARRWRVGAVHKCYTRVPFARGGSKPFAAIRILSVERQTLGDMTEDDARKEGGYTLAEFRQLWCEMHGGWNPCEEVWVVEFRLEEIT